MICELNIFKVCGICADMEDEKELKVQNSDDDRIRVYHKEGKLYADKQGIYYHEISLKHEYFREYHGGYTSRVKTIIDDVTKKYRMTMNPKVTNDNSGACDSFGNIFYDSLTIIISFADLATDLVMLYNYYQNGWTGFFITSLVVIILAQLAYCVLFAWKYGANKTIYCCDYTYCNDKICKGCCGGIFDIASMLIDFCFYL